MEPWTLRLHCVAIKILLFALLLPPSVTLVLEPWKNKCETSVHTLQIALFPGPTQLFHTASDESRVIHGNETRYQALSRNTCTFTVAVLTPLHYVAYLGELAVRFHCSAANASNISWHINGSSIGRNFYMGIITETDLNLLESNLTISSMIINNNTRIQCRVHHLDEHNFTLTDEATVSRYTVITPAICLLTY